MLALFISISRISDYKHHPLDVVVGIAVGVVFALIVLLIVVDLFRRPLAFYWEMTEKEALFLEVVLNYWDNGWRRAMMHEYFQVETSMTDKIIGNHSKDDIDFPRWAVLKKPSLGLEKATGKSFTVENTFHFLAQVKKILDLSFRRLPHIHQILDYEVSRWKWDIYLWNPRPKRSTVPIPNWLVFQVPC